VGVSIFSTVTAIGREGMASGCVRGGSGWILREISSQKEQCCRHWNRLLRKVVKSLSLGVFKNRVDVALRDVVSGHNGSWLTIGLDDNSGPFQP